MHFRFLIEGELQFGNDKILNSKDSVHVYKLFTKQCHFYPLSRSIWHAHCFVAVKKVQLE